MTSENNIDSVYAENNNMFFLVMFVEDRDSIAPLSKSAALENGEGSDSDSSIDAFNAGTISQSNALQELPWQT